VGAAHASLPAWISAGIETPRLAVTTVIRKTAEAAENATALRLADHRKATINAWLANPATGV
jgi:hypothetical protein